MGRTHRGEEHAHWPEFWGIKLVKGADDNAHAVGESETLWTAVRTLAIADAVMSLENVVAIAAASRGHPELFVFGLLLSIPLIIAGASLITTLIQRFPIIIWAGAALLGWIAGEMIVTDPFVAERVKASVEAAGYAAAGLGALLVLGLGYVLSQRHQSTPEAAGKPV